MERKAIPTSVDNFKELIENGYYYVDKTGFIEEILRKKTKVLLVTRPRRFGKTLNISTLKYFFDVRDAEENRKLFRGLKIEKTEYMEHQGKYPVIHITMKDMKEETYEEFLESFIRKISNLFNNHKYIREKLDGRDLEKFDKIWYGRKDGDYKVAIQMLSEMLYEYHGVKPVILIDEYDAPMIDANSEGYYDKVQKLIGTFYGSALKDGCCSFAVITGILKVAKESIFSTLNNLDVSTILTGDYNHFGMTEEEVLEILQYYGWETTIEDTREWYNGYLFGDERVYNPWSITHHCKAGKLEAFWIGTSANLLIKEILRTADKTIYNLMYDLIQDGEVKAILQENMVFGKNSDDDTLLYLMFSGGYLTISRKGEKRKEYYLKIPNYEVKEYFQDTFIEIATSNSKSSFLLLEEALLDENILIAGGKRDSIEELVRNMLETSMSYMDGSTTTEKFYHNLILGMVIGMDSKFIPLSNREAGYGRYDLALIPKIDEKTKKQNLRNHGYIFEFKITKSEDEMERLGMGALAQIERKNYEKEFQSRGYLNIHKIGMVFCGKQVKLYTE